MPTFIGFNTINQNKKFTAVDFDLIKIDLLNAFNFTYHFTDPFINMLARLSKTYKTFAMP